jgi:hypothetical protein
VPGSVLAFGVRDVGEFGDRVIEHVVELAEQAALAVTVAEQARVSRGVAASNTLRRGTVVTGMSVHTIRTELFG